MTAAATTVLKREKVRMAGACRLGAHGVPAGAAPDAPGVPAGRTQGRIIQQNDDGAVVEVTCACGRTIHLYCTYGPA